VTDRYGVSYYLLGGCFLEVVMFHCDFGWDLYVEKARPIWPTGRGSKAAG